MPPLEGEESTKYIVPVAGAHARRCLVTTGELELELIQSQMAQKPMLRGEVSARAWRV